MSNNKDKRSRNTKIAVVLILALAVLTAGLFMMMGENDDADIDQTPQPTTEAPAPTETTDTETTEEPDQETTQWEDLDADKIETEYLALVNDYRAEHNLDPIERTDQLDANTEDTATEWADGNTDAYTERVCHDDRGSGQLIPADSPSEIAELDESVSNEDVAQFLFDRNNAEYQDTEFYMLESNGETGLGLVIPGENPGLYMTHQICLVE